MIETTNAEKLRITEGFVVWVIGRTVEATALLDPLPESAETVEDRDEDEPELIDAAIMVVDTREDLIDDLDEVLPQLGSIPIVWICYPHRSVGLGEDLIGDLVADYGWAAVETVELDETWSGIRILQA